MLWCLRQATSTCSLTSAGCGSSRRGGLVRSPGIRLHLGDQRSSTAREGVRSLTDSNVWGDMPCQRSPCFLGHHPRNGVVHSSQPHPWGVHRYPGPSHYPEPSRYRSCNRPSQHSWATELSGRRGTRGGGSHDTKGNRVPSADDYIALNGTSLAPCLVLSSGGNVQNDRVHACQR